MLAYIGPLGLEARRNRDPILEGPELTHLHPFPPSSQMKQPGAKNTHSCVE